MVSCRFNVYKHLLAYHIHDLRIEREVETLMPRGVKKTFAESLAEMERDKEHFERRMREKPLKSPCLKGRLKHQFRHRQTHGELTLRNHADWRCKWCNKTLRQVRDEQRKKS